ncbi:hypothetical protein HCN51_39290 [Nonomuraea sp. FMUSA5-5]|uniref:ParB/Sulfiredoxin domain-containing protein n=1 Tax=Nonomuraea composti TaxID=2720023 RepID=A0ABX1BI06_9ACTN|nr:hypothetical protein [Nonomuraea sp. FMUSA5-5]NJP95416.1 hypothetical protein [Nonomuraea sp. FMUSA5-5]
MNRHSVTADDAPASNGPGSGRVDSSSVEFFQMLAWRWNVTAAKKLTKGRTPAGRIETREWAGMLRLIVINAEHAAQVDLSEPLIMAPVPNGGMLIIDGWHRLHKALNSSVPELSAVVLTAEEELACRMFGGDKGEGYIR